MENIENKPPLSWSTLQRMKFIEFRLLWKGHINRRDLIDTFGISVPQTTIDFREYMERAPGNMDYTKKQRHYFPLPTFTPIFIADTAEYYLQNLTELNLTNGSQCDPGLSGIIPSFDVLPLPKRSVNQTSFQKILQAIENKSSIEIDYQSLTSAEHGWRWISPHALASDGIRWHVRAFCHTSNEFRDFVLGRIIEIRGNLTSTISAENDFDWNSYVRITIKPNPGLTPDQVKIIEQDYCMIDGKSEIIARKAFLFYYEHLFGTENTTEDNPAANQVVISSIDYLASTHSL